MWAWRRNPSALVGFALLSILAGTAWQVASVVIVALFYKGPALAPMAMMIEVLVNPQHYLLFFVYMCVGGLLAALVFAVSVVDAERIPNHGGSIRVYAVKGTGNNPSGRLQELVKQEESYGLHGSALYATFAQRVRQSKWKLLSCFAAGLKGSFQSGMACP